MLFHSSTNQTDGDKDTGSQREGWDGRKERSERVGMQIGRQCRKDF